MKQLKIKNTYNLNLKGEPSTIIEEVIHSNEFIINPVRIKNFKSKLVVKENQAVAIGSLLLIDKKQPHLKFLSPVSGVVKEIVYGHRRVVEKVVIQKDSAEKVEELFSPVTDDQLTKLSREDVVSRIIDGGLWNLITQYPFEAAPKQDDIAPSIYVTVDYDEPFMPESAVFLKEYYDDFVFGLEIIKKLSSAVYVGVSEKNKFDQSKLNLLATHRLEGDYPANNPGVFLYHNKKTQEENASWGIRSLDIIRIGQLFKSGNYPIERLIVLAGTQAKKPRYIKTREAISLNFLSKEFVNSDPVRIIAGGVLTGDKVSLESGLGYNDYAINLIREGQERELLTFFRGGYDKPTFGNTYLSAINKKQKFSMTSSTNGGHRACISCGVCAKVCQVDSAPQMIMKSLNVDDIETAVKYGLLDIVDTGLYTYVCPSKIELDEIFRAAKTKLYKEVTA